MKHALLILMSVVMLTLTLPSCKTVNIKQHNIGCFDRSKADVLRSATALLVQHGFTVTMADTVIGIVQGETPPSHDIWTGMNSKRVWQITVSPILDKQASANAALTAPVGAQAMYIMAMAKTVNSSQNAFGSTLSTSEEYYDDKSHKDWEWYWGVRNGLESICGTKAVITSKKLY